MSKENAPTSSEEMQNNVDHHSLKQLQKIYETRELLARPSPWLIGSVALDSASKFKFSEPDIMTLDELRTIEKTKKLLARPSPWLTKQP